jgi:hypothetical protein
VSFSPCNWKEEANVCERKHHKEEASKDNRGKKQTLKKSSLQRLSKCSQCRGKNNACSKATQKAKTNSSIQTPAKGKDSTIILIILIHNQLQRIGSFNTPVDDTASSSSSRLLQSDLCQGLYNSEAMEK